MHRYEPLQYRLLSGLAALVMSALTMAVMVALPATAESGDPSLASIPAHGSPAEARSPSATPADAARDARIDDRDPHHVAAVECCLCAASTQAYEDERAWVPLSCD